MERAAAWRRVPGRRCLLTVASIWLGAGIGLSVRAAAATGCAVVAPTSAEAHVEFMPVLGEVLAWREWPGVEGICRQVDWPEPARLSGVAPDELQRLLDLAEQRRRQVLAPTLPRADVEAARRSESSPWNPVAQVPAPDGRPPLPLCPRVLPRAQMTPVELPAPLAATVLRVRPHRCEPGARPMAGSGVLLSPRLGLTAAHVVMTPAGLICSRYRVAPGGRRFADPPNAPYGINFVTRALLSERGGWSLAAAAPPRDRDPDARTAHDYAWLLLDEPATVPADTVWPRLRFGAPAGPVGAPLLSAGYSAQTPVARSAPGAMVALFGQTACPLAGEQARRQALWMSFGGSGGPIWSWFPTRPLELHSLASRVEGLPGERFETLGPNFDLVDYQQLLKLLRLEHERRLELARHTAQASAIEAAAASAEPEAPAARRNCTINPNPDSLLGQPGLGACRVRCATRPRSCQASSEPE